MEEQITILSENIKIVYKIKITFRNKELMNKFNKFNEILKNEPTKLDSKNNNIRKLLSHCNTIFKGEFQGNSFIQYITIKPITKIKKRMKKGELEKIIKRRVKELIFLLKQNKEIEINDIKIKMESKNEYIVYQNKGCLKGLEITRISEEDLYEYIYEEVKQEYLGELPEFCLIFPISLPEPQIIKKKNYTITISRIDNIDQYLEKSNGEIYYDDLKFIINNYYMNLEKYLSLLDEIPSFSTSSLIKVEVG